MKKPYTIRKVVICDIIDEACTELMPYNTPIAPDCEHCPYYIEWKKKQKEKVEE